MKKRSWHIQNNQFRLAASFFAKVWSDLALQFFIPGDFVLINNHVHFVILLSIAYYLLVHFVSNSFQSYGVLV